MQKAFINANIIDVIGEKVIKNGAVLVEDDKIKAVGTDVQIPADAEVIDLVGRTMLPGLFNCHVHMCSDAGPVLGDISDANNTIRALKNLKTMINSGVTYIRDACAPNGIDIDIHHAQLKGDVLAPEMQTAGRSICMTGGHSHDLGGMECDGPDECRKGARLQLKAGADWIKVMATGGVMTKSGEPGSPQLTEEEMRAAIEEAHKAGAKTFTHAQGMEGIKNALRAGVDSIEHGFFMDDWCFDFMKEHDVFFVPTLAAPYWIKVYGTAAGIPAHMVRKVEETIEAHKETFRRAHAAGVKIALGTDAGTPFNKYEMTGYEAVLMVEAGMSPMEAIKCGTINAAEMMRVKNTHGSITPGKRANFSIFANDPLSDIHALLDCAMTVIGGKVVFAK